MANRFLENFSSIATAGLNARGWTTVISSPSVVTDFPRAGTACVKLGGSGAGYGGLRKVLDQQSVWTVGLFLYIESYPGGTDNTAHTIMGLEDTSSPGQQINLALNAAGAVILARGSTVLATGPSLPLATYMYIEMKITVHNSTGTYEVRKDGIAIIGPATGQNTRNLTNNSANAIRIGWAAAVGAGSIRVGDIYINDGTGGAHDSFEGDCRVYTSYATGAGDTTDWTPSTGSNYQCVDEANMNSDTDYVSSNTPNQVDTYNVTDLPSNSGAPKVVQIGAFARKDDAGPRSIALVTRPVATDRVGSDQPLPGSYALLFQTREVNPDTAAAWTRAEFNATKFGVKLTV